MFNVLIAGDFGVRHRITEYVERKNFDPIFFEAKKIIDDADYSIVNFEMPIVEHDAKPIKKCGPNLKCRENSLDAIKYLGFKCLTLANNHFFDFGDIGVKDTFAAIQKYALDYVGAGSNEETAKKILYRKIKDKILAVINCCEEESSIASIYHGGSNHINPVHIYYQIIEAKKNADYVIVITHGGHEHFQYPSLRMQDTYRFFIDAGADAVVNHHQHCHSGYEIYNNKPIVYGLGNFCFDRPDKRNDIWNKGFLVRLFFSDKITLEVIPYIQNDESPGIRFTNDKTTINDINEIIANRNKLIKQNNAYYNATESSIAGIFEPIQNRYFRALQRRHIIPSLVNSQWLTQLVNFILCESHRDRVSYYFKKYRDEIQN